MWWVAVWVELGAGVSKNHRVCVPRPTQFFAINEKWLLVRSMN